MRDITLEELLEAGCHFGHQVIRHNPKSRDFVFEARDNIHIIDLAKTKEGLVAAAEYVRSVAQRGGDIIVVGTKRQARPIVLEEIERAQKEGAEGMYYVTNRWIGGILTNLPEVTKNFKKLADYKEKLKSEEERARYTKKEIGWWQKEKNKLESFYGGISTMTKLPEALFIIDTHFENLAVREARQMNVPIVGIVDTNADPFVINHPIPANDDAVGSVKLIVGYIVDAWIEGRKNAKKIQEDEEKKKVEAEAKPQKEEKKPAEKKVEKESSEKKTEVSKVVEKPKKAAKKTKVKKEEVKLVE